MNILVIIIIKVVFYCKTVIMITVEFKISIDKFNVRHLTIKTNKF